MMLATPIILLVGQFLLKRRSPNICRGDPGPHGHAARGMLGAVLAGDMEF